MKKRKSLQISLFFILFALSFLLMVQPAKAWNIHPLFMHPVLFSMPEVKNSKPVTAKSLKTFLTEEEQGLVKLLIQEEEWAQNNLEWYMPRPDTQVFKATGDGGDIVQRFVQAIRINPDFRIQLYLQLLPGDDRKGRSPISKNEITFLKEEDLEYLNSTTFVALKEGEDVTPLEVVVSATDEPDLGIDVGLYSDNSTRFGKTYGFGTQAFGNPNLDYGSQAPFHMGFYHESKILYAFAGFLKETYPEYRIHLFKTLAEFAFRRGQDYWGWRFMGWGLHYLGDLSQPYHTTVFPGTSTTKVLWINVLAMAGFPGAKNDAVQILSNRHIVLERFQQEIFQRAYRQSSPSFPIFKILKSPANIPAYKDSFPREKLARKSNAMAAELNDIITNSAPHKFISDPKFEFGKYKEAGQIIENIKKSKGQEGVDSLVRMIGEAMKPLTVYGRSYVLDILKPGETTAKQ